MHDTSCGRGDAVECPKPGQASGVGASIVQDVLAAEDIKPHRFRYWKTSHDPEFEPKMMEIVGLYLNPPDNAIVLSVDEKTSIQALDRTQPLLPLRPHQIERRSHEYKRNGTTSLLASLEVHSGKVSGVCIKKNDSDAFIAFRRRFDLAPRPVPGRDLFRRHGVAAARRPDHVAMVLHDRRGAEDPDAHDHCARGSTFGGETPAR
jgi:hypothetical protein